MGYYNQPLLATYSVYNRLTYSVLPDGVTPEYTDTPSLPEIDCNAGTPSTCGATVTVYNGQIYIAYADYNTRGLDVALATPVSGAAGYSIQLIHQDNTAALVTQPTAVVFNGMLIYIFGTSSNPNVKNAFFETTFNGANWTTASEQYLGGSPLGVSSPVQPAIAVLNGTLRMCSQQNNSHHNMILYSSTDGVIWSYVGTDSNLQIGGGATMVNINGTLVLANQQNNSNRALFIFNSTDGINWTYQEYPGIQMGGTPALALFGGDVSLLFQSNGPGKQLYTDIAAQ
jgi:hypothetical protein